MGCSCSGSSQNESTSIRTNRRERDRESRAEDRSQNNNSQQNRRSENRQQQQQQQNQQQPRQNANMPNYEPFLQSKNDPSFNMKQLKEMVGEGVKKMHAYVCNLEKDDLERKRHDFWTSRFEGSPETWDLLKLLCEGEFSNKELNELLFDSQLKPYAGCINVIYDSKGNLYEIPNYCIHDPLEWDIQKLKIPQPDEEKISIIVRLGISDLKVNTVNLCPVKELKLYIIKKFDFSNTDYKEGITDTARIRLFHYGKEMKDTDMLYMHSVESGKIVMMAIRPS